MTDLYDKIQPGQLAKIQGRKAVYLYYASYGGGSGPLWAVEGVEAQFTTHADWDYRRAVCRRVSPEAIELVLEDGTSTTVPIGDVGRYDQMRVPGEGLFRFSDTDIVLLAPEGDPTTVRL